LGVPIRPDGCGNCPPIKLARQQKEPFLCPDWAHDRNVLFHQLDDADAAVRLPFRGVNSSLQASRPFSSATSFMVV
jgi:hypothetical protein